MALPNGLKSVLRPLVGIARVITPTGMGVMLSVGAHAALIAYGPRTDVSFAALQQADQNANPEETIVPILQLSEAERNRLPSFAQPRRPPASTGLSSLQLPSGIPSFSRPTQNRTLTRKAVPRASLPPANTRSPISPLNQVFPNSTIQRTPVTINPSRVNVQAAPSVPSGTTFIPSPNTNSADTPSVGEDGLPRLQGQFNDEGDVNIAAIGTGENSPGADALRTEPRGVLDEIIDNQANASSGNEGSDDTPDSPIAANEVTEQSPISLEVQDNAETIAVLPAEGDSSTLLQNSTAYSDVGVSEEEVEENTELWLARSAEGKAQVAAEESSITIDSGFKACREMPPEDGLIGVLVNPDGSRESIETLKSTGYGALNSLALSILEYEDFGQPDVPTQYTVEVNVVYEPDDCVEDLPDAPPAEE